MNKTEAIKATRNGVIAACISAVGTLVIMLIAITSNTGGKLAYWSDLRVVFDVFLILACAYGIYRKSRVASVLLFLYFLTAKIVIVIESQIFNVYMVAVALVFLYFFGKAIQGSFVYHKLEKEENPEYKATTKWTYIIGIPLVVLVVLFIGYVFLSTIGVFPSTRVQSGSEVKTNDINTLIGNSIISDKDTVEYFYSEGLTSILESGNILTQDRVIVYFTDENNELKVYEIPINDIVDVKLESQGGTFNNSVYKVITNDPERWLPLILSVEQKGDRKFVGALRNKISR